jgi:hypothetical protein
VHDGTSQTQAVESIYPAYTPLKASEWRHKIDMGLTIKGNRRRRDYLAVRETMVTKEGLIVSHEIHRLPPSMES